MTQEYQLCWRQTVGQIPVPSCPAAVQGCGGEASDQSLLKAVQQRREKSKRALSCTTAQGCPFYQIALLLLSHS